METERGPRVPLRLPLARAVVSLSLTLVVALLLLIAGSQGAAHSTTPAEVVAQADSLRDAGNPQAAASLVAANVANARASRDSVFLLQLTGRWGALLCGFGQARQAEVTLREALSLAEAARDSSAQCSALRWLGVALSYQGRGEEAAVLYTRLLDTAQACGDVPHQGWARIGFGWGKLCHGQAVEALDQYEQALTAFITSGTRGGIAFAWNGIGLTHHRLGAYDQALVAYRNCAEVAETIAYGGMRAFLLNVALNNLATLELHFGDPGVAAQHFRDLSRMAIQAGDVRASIIPGLNTAQCLGQLGRYTDALEECETLATRCREENYRDLLGKVLIQSAQAQRAAGNLPDAAAILREVLATGDELATIDRVEAAIALAEIQYSADSTAAALATLERAERLHAANQDAGQGRTLSTGRGVLLLALGRAEEALPYLMDVADEERRLGLTRATLVALSTAARACQQLGWPDSARVLLERAAHAWESDRGIPLDPEWRERRGAESREIYTDLAMALLDSPVPSTEQERARAVFDRLQIFKARTLMERVRGPRGPPSPDDGRMTSPGDLATVEALQNEILRPGELLIDAFLGPRASLIIAVTKSECRVVRLPPEKALDDKLRRYHGLLATPPPSTDLLGEQLRDAVSQNLREELFGELDDLLARTERVFVAPDGGLSLLPLAVLLSVDGDYPEVARIPSATFMTWSRRQPSPGAAVGPIRVLAIGGERTRGGERLPGAVREVRMLERHFTGVDALIAGNDADVSGVRERLPDYDLLHVAAHAEVNDRNPWRSVIVLDPDDPQTWLHADQISALPLNARLAVLSSCESARGKVLSGEGVLGLCQAFLSAGVPAVVATLWPVDDGAAMCFMERFYPALAAGHTAGEALRIAQQDLRSEASFAHPYYWAGYVLTGLSDTHARLTLRRFTARSLRPWGLGLLGLLVFAFLVRSGRRPRGAPQPAEDERKP